MTAYPWRIEVRNAALERVGELDDYQQLELTPKFNDVSGWQLTVDRRSRLAVELTEKGAGIIVSRNGSTVLSGPWTSERHTKTADTNQLVLSGVDDTVWLKRRLTHPQPGTAAPPYSTSAEYVSTGTASSVMALMVLVNEGSSALAPRQKIDIITDPVYGVSVTGRGRWQSLLTLLQDLAVQGAVGGIPVGFKVVQTGGQLEFKAYAPVDRTATVVFSEGLGNLLNFTFERTAPEGNYWFVGGSGEGTARTIYEQPDSASIAEWGRIEGEFVDASSAASTAELSQAATKADADHGEKTSMSIVPLDSDDLAYGVHYGLGDRITAVVDALGPTGEGIAGTVVQDILRECKITLTPDSTTVEPTIGSQDASIFPVKLIRKVLAQGKRLVNQERR